MMKNLFLYTSPNRCLDKESEVLLKIQIDNSLELGWRKEDLLFVTNFDYRYRGMKALVVGDFYHLGDKTSNKVLVINELFNLGLIEKECLYWYHDLDAYENNKIVEKELGLDGVDLGLTNYGYKTHWNCGSLFFNFRAKDIFALWLKKVLQRRKRSRVDEKALKFLTDHGLIDKRRYKTLGTTYNFQYLYLPRHYYYDKAEKPLHVLHFHPDWTKKQDNRLYGETMLDVYMYGKGKLSFPLMSERLIRIFNEHGIF